MERDCSLRSVSRQRTPNRPTRSAPSVSSMCSSEASVPLIVSPRPMPGAENQHAERRRSRRRGLASLPHTVAQRSELGQRRGLRALHLHRQCHRLRSLRAALRRPPPPETTGTRSSCACRRVGTQRRVRPKPGHDELRNSGTSPGSDCSCRRRSRDLLLGCRGLSRGRVVRRAPGSTIPRHPDWRGARGDSASATHDLSLLLAMEAHAFVIGSRRRLRR